jgi:hypothetical protein
MALYGLEGFQMIPGWCQMVTGGCHNVLWGKQMATGGVNCTQEGVK